MQYLPLVTTLISACVNHQPNQADDCRASASAHKIQVSTQWTDHVRPAKEQWFEDHALYKIQQIKQLKQGQ